jgi:hypothetical protein
MKPFTPLFERLCSEPAKALNPSLLAGFQALADSPQSRRSHYFGGRYENIYIHPEQLPAYAELLTIARQHAARLLSCSADRLKVGGWFNAMASGQVTTLHSHDDDDEVLSAVYYVDVPVNSGELVLMAADGMVRIEPEAGSFVFFSPRMPHEVTENCSDGLRLSIGMNFGYEGNCD